MGIWNVKCFEDVSKYVVGHIIKGKENNKIPKIQILFWEFYYLEEALIKA